MAWTGLEHFRVGRFDPPPPAIEPDDFVVRSSNKAQYFLKILSLKKMKDSNFLIDDFVGYEYSMTFDRGGLLERSTQKEEAKLVL